MKATDVAKRLRALGATKVRQAGSHATYRSACGRCTTVVPMHAGDVGVGLLHKIQRDLAPCYGADWLIRR